MKSKAVWALLAAFVLPLPAARADILELRGKGFVNGKVLSETDSEIRLADSKGRVHVYPKADILSRHVSKGSAAPGEPEKKKFFKHPIGWLRDYLDADRNRRKILKNEARAERLESGDGECLPGESAEEMRYAMEPEEQFVKDTILSPKATGREE